MYVVMWQYQVKAGCENEFERAYGREGEWVHLFRGSKGYLGTELLKDVVRDRRYLTIDRWTSQEEYESFLEEHVSWYQAIDRRCEVFTEMAASLGTYQSVGKYGSASGS